MIYLVVYVGDIIIIDGDQKGITDWSIVSKWNFTSKIGNLEYFLGTAIGHSQGLSLPQIKYILDLVGEADSQDVNLQTSIGSQY